MEFAKTVTLKDNSECLIRNTEAADAQAVLDIFLLTHEQTDFLASYRDEATFDADFEKKFLAGKKNSEREVYLCAVLDGKIVGTASVDGIGPSKVSHRCELGIAIDEKFWGMGIGRALITACIDCARKARYLQMELEVVRENENAVALYSSMGFTEFGRNPRGFLSRTQGFQELIYMRLELG